MHAAARYEKPPIEEGLTAIALFDYQKNDDDEISFEPNDIITNIEQVVVDAKLFTEKVV